jgi:hypothetical protein
MIKSKPVMAGAVMGETAILPVMEESGAGLCEDDVASSTVKINRRDRFDD